MSLDNVSFSLLDEFGSADARKRRGLSGHKWIGNAFSDSQRRAVM
jgi:hypothetical protein